MNRRVVSRRAARQARSVRTLDRRRRARSTMRRRLTPREQMRSRRWQNVHGGARSALRNFRQASLLAVAMTAMFLMLFGLNPTEAETTPAADTPAPTQTVDDMSQAGDVEGAESPQEESVVEPANPQKSLEEATSTIRGLWNGVVDVLPKVAIAAVLLLLAWLISAIVRIFLRHALSGWQRGEAVAALVRIALFLLAIGAGLSVISGDATALVGSVGLVGLALSWALQTPIESFTGWVLNAMRGYYGPGDRIEVGDVFGDVYRIDVLNTTVWETGGPGKSVAGAQPTGALITFPNWEILRSNIINYSRDFPYIWDEVTFAIANESDLNYTVEVLRKASDAVVGEMMKEPAENYRRLLERQRLAYAVEEKPQIYLSLADMWTNCTVRYLVPLRERRRWSSELILKLSAELARPEHAGRIISGYPKQKIVQERAEELGND